MQLALFEPDIPQNLGVFIRLAICLDVPLHVIEPCGFPIDDRRIRRAAMDYYDLGHLPPRVLTNCRAHTATRHPAVSSAIPGNASVAPAERIAAAVPWR